MALEVSPARRRRKRLFEQKTTGVIPKHSRSCPGKNWDEAGVCDCTPVFLPWVSIKGKPVYAEQRFTSLNAATAWRRNAETDKDRGKLRETPKALFVDEADAIIAGLNDDSIRSRKREPFKPKVKRDYISALERLKIDFGPHEYAKIRRKDWQTWADERLAEGMSGSRVDNLLMPARLLYRRAIRNGDLEGPNPLSDLDLPAPGTREREWPDPQEAHLLIEALETAFDKALWATPFYAGPRMGELRALEIEDIDPELRWIDVARSWDDVEGVIDPKSKAGRRRIPIPDHLRVYLEPHLKSLARDTGLVFGETATTPFNYGKTTRRAYKAFEAAKSNRITLHEARHSYKTFLDYAGLSEARCDRYLGHANHSVGRRYTHSLESELAADAALLDSYLEGREKGVVVPLRQAS